MPTWVGHSPAQLNNAARYFPLVGAVVGVLAASVIIIGSCFLPLSVVLLLSMAFSIFITGAFHEDGVSDYADGMGGGFTRERVLDIMKDSRIGSYGAITIVMVLLIKFHALNEIGSLVGQPHAATMLSAILVMGHVTSRFAAVLVMRPLRYIRDADDARAKPAADSLSTLNMWVAFITTVLALAIAFAACHYLITVTSNHFLSYALATAIFSTLLMWVYLVWRLRVRLGGYTGDCLGATQQLCEIAFYIGWLGALTMPQRLL